MTLCRDLLRMGLPVYIENKDVMGIYEEGLKILEETRAEGLAPSVHQFERKLQRRLTDVERATVLMRLGKLRAVRLGDIALDLDGAQLAAWLADPDAR